MRSFIVFRLCSWYYQRTLLFKEGNLARNQCYAKFSAGAVRGVDTVNLYCKIVNWKYYETSKATYLLFNQTLQTSGINVAAICFPISVIFTCNVGNT